MEKYIQTDLKNLIQYLEYVCITFKIGFNDLMIYNILF